DNRLTGFFRFIIGLSKKVLIANVLGREVDQIFALSEIELTSYLAWMGVIAYTFQIYFDFSGYSDMAIGIGRMIGFKFPENFNNPYISQSITEFWRRWHITLGRWMKDYLYIPLGGNKVSPKRLYFNLWIVFLISGLWHGAAWNFIIWGAFHGFFLVADRLFLLKVYAKIGKIPSIAITFFITMIGWVLFRAENLHESGIFLKKMFSFDFSPTSYFLNEKFFIILFIAIFFSFWGISKKIELLQNRLFFTEKKDVSIILMSGFAIIFMIISLASITSSDFNPFIYFRF
ncbi:MAG: MBOAT family protein, partial [Bacteroidales bacterium]|nr:MBOAT family protein [Bacteroidales bacterium]